jgi:carboxymethylenebutenolidase
LVSRGDCTRKTGVIGFCIGGGFALLSATNGYDAAAVNYGQLPRDLDAAGHPRRQGVPARQPRISQRRRSWPPLAAPLLRVTGIGPEPDSAQDAWHRITAFFNTYLN